MDYDARAVKHQKLDRGDADRGTLQTRRTTGTERGSEQLTSSHPDKYMIVWGEAKER